MYAPKNQPARGRYENSLIHSVKLFKASLSFFFFSDIPIFMRKKFLNT